MELKQPHYVCACPKSATCNSAVIVHEFVDPYYVSFSNLTKDIFFFCTLVFLLFRCFPSVLVCNPDLFSLNLFMIFEKRYTTFALIF